MASLAPVTVRRIHDSSQHSNQWPCFRSAILHAHACSSPHKPIDLQLRPKTASEFLPTCRATAHPEAMSLSSVSFPFYEVDREVAFASRIVNLSVGVTRCMDVAINKVSVLGPACTIRRESAERTDYRLDSFGPIVTLSLVMELLASDMHHRGGLLLVPVWRSLPQMSKDTPLTELLSFRRFSQYIHCQTCSKFLSLSLKQITGPHFMPVIPSGPLEILASELHGHSRLQAREIHRTIHRHLLEPQGHHRQ